MSRRNLLVLASLFAVLSVTVEAFSGAPEMKSFVPRETPDGWVSKGDPQVLTKDTLFEHIDGQADLFLQYGFQQSVFTTYRKDNSSKGKIELDIYDMGNVLEAFGVFSRFRQGDRPAGIGLDSYVEGHYALFYKGKYFVVIQAGGSTPSGLEQLARTIGAKITDSSPAPKEIGYFPNTGLKRGSIEYYPQGLMGRQFLKRGFRATYLVPDKSGGKPEARAEGPDSSLFLAIFDNTEEAEGALKTFKEDLAKKGSAAVAVGTAPGFDSVKGADPYQGKLIMVHKGQYLAGAAGFEEDKTAEDLVAELLKHVPGI